MKGLTKLLIHVALSWRVNWGCDGRIGKIGQLWVDEVLSQPVEHSRQNESGMGAEMLGGDKDLLQKIFYGCKFQKLV